MLLFSSSQYASPFHSGLPPTPVHTPAVVVLVVVLVVVPVVVCGHVVPPPLSFGSRHPHTSQ